MLFRDGKALNDMEIEELFAVAFGASDARDRDASLAEDAQRLSGEAVAARAEGIAT